MNVRGRIEPGENLFHELLDLIIRAASFELGNPDGSTGRDLARILNILLKVGSVGCTIIPALLSVPSSCRKDGYHFGKAYQWMLIKSMLQPVQASMNDERYFKPFAPLVTAGEPRYIFSLSAFWGSIHCFQAATAVLSSMQEPPMPDLSPSVLSCTSLSEIDLLAVVRLVEAEQMSGHVPIAKGGLPSIKTPLTGVIWAIGVQHRDELESCVGVAVGTRVPVVGLYHN